MVGDPDQVRALAATVRWEAERVRRIAVTIGGTRAVAWRAAAGEAFRERVSGLVHLLMQRSRQLDDAADDLDRHAASVQSVVDQVGRAVVQGQRQVHEVERAIRSTVDR